MINTNNDSNMDESHMQHGTHVALVFVAISLVTAVAAAAAVTEDDVVAVAVGVADEDDEEDGVAIVDVSSVLVSVVASLSTRSHF